jgi:hypothetical protein
MSTVKPSFHFGAGNLANGGTAGGPTVRRESRIRKGWTFFDVWQDRVRRAAEAARTPTHIDMTTHHAGVTDL